MHELGPEPNFNESMYFNFFDPARNVGGFLRLGNRPNEGLGEMTVCLFLASGRVAFMFRRPDVSTNDAFDAGGMRFEVIEPFTALRVTYRGTVAVLDEPLAMEDPRAAFASSPQVPCEVQLDYRGVAPMVGGEPEQAMEPPGEEFARGHYEQLVSAAGQIAVGGERTAVEGYGLRDHSWGPRHWQAPWYYRWLTASFGPDFGFMGSRIARRAGGGLRGGFVWDGTDLHHCHDLRLHTTWTDGAHYHREVHADLVAADREWSVRGTVISLIPLRNRRPDSSGQLLTTRISEGLTRWILDDGRIGYGLSEYLDQLVDGEPVGLAE